MNIQKDTLSLASQLFLLEPVPRPVSFFSASAALPLPLPLPLPAAVLEPEVLAPFKSTSTWIPGTRL